MRKTTVPTLILTVLMLSLTQLASAQWMTNTVTNQTSGTIYVVWSTAYPAVGTVPEAGYRTSGWINLLPGQQEGFWGFANHRVYFLILKGGDPIKPSSSIDTFSSWVDRSANFDIVTEREINAPTARGDILYNSTRINGLSIQDGFLRYRNGSSVNVTSNWVDLRGIPLAGPPDDRDALDMAEAEDMDSDGTDDTPRPSSLAVDGDISISAGETGTITATVRSAGGEALREVTVRFSENSDHISLSRTSGTTDNSGKVSTTVTAISQGGAVLSVAVDGYPALTKHEAITVGETPPSSLTLNSIPSPINEGDSRTITATLKSESGNPISGKTIRFQESSGVISFSSTSGTTNSSGQVSTTLRTSYVSSRSTARFHVKVDGYSGLDTSRTVPVVQVANNLAIGPTLPSTTNSGERYTITATVKSKGGHLMSGARVQFSESSSYLRFIPTSASTNATGKVSSTLRTGGHGGDSKLYITVTVPGTSLRVQDWTRVKGVEKPFSKVTSFASRKDCGNNNINGEYDWSRTITVPGKIIGQVRYEWEIPADDACCIKVTGGQFVQNSSGFKVYGRTFPHCRNPNNVEITVSGIYRRIAALPAPSLHPQLRPEPDQLSMFWEDMSQVPSETALLPNYPNPFNPETWIPYHLSEPANVTLAIYSADGRLVRTLALGHQTAGVYENKSRAAYWDGRNAMGERVASGVYFYTLTAGDFTATGKMLIMK